MNRRSRSLVAPFALGVLAIAAIASPTRAEDGYSPYAGVEYPTNVYWGDTHVHSSWSPDAGGSGNEKLETLVSEPHDDDSHFDQSPVYDDA